MTLAIALVVVGAVMIYSAIMDVSIADALTGKAPDTPPDDFLHGIAAGAGVGVEATGPMPAGIVTWEGEKVCAWIAAELQKARDKGWKGKITPNNGYRDNAGQARACANTSGPCAKPGESMHQGTAYPSCAVDIGTDPQGLSRILVAMGSPLIYAGAKDNVHFSHPHGGSY